MTIKELKKLIKDLPDHMDVMIHQENNEFNLAQVQVGKVTTCHYSEEEGGEVLAEEEVFVLTDDFG